MLSSNCPDPFEKRNQPDGINSRDCEATMTAVQTQKPTGSATSSSTRALLRVVILCLIAGAAIASRLFSVIRK